MIECEGCRRYFHVDEINECPNCVIELCESCYKIHIGLCLAEEEEEDTDDEKLPAECPNCGEELELDINYDKTTLYCEECDFEMDVTERLASDEEIVEELDI